MIRAALGVVSECARSPPGPVRPGGCVGDLAEGPSHRKDLQRRVMLRMACRDVKIVFSARPKLSRYVRGTGERCGRYVASRLPGGTR